MLQHTTLRSILIRSATILPLLTGCLKPAAQPTPDEPVRQTTVGVSLWKTDDPWRAQMKADIEAAAAKHPEVRFVFRDAQDNAEKQRADVEEFLAHHANLIIISPKNAQILAEPIAKAFTAGIPVIVVDRPIIGDKYTCFIAPNNKQIGTAAGKWLAEKLGKKGKIVEIRGPIDSIPNQERHAAFRAALRDPGYRFIYEGYVDPPRVDASDIMRETMEHADHIDAVYAYTDEAAQAAYETAKSAQREKDVLFLGIGGLPTGGQKFVSEGILDATFLHPTCGTEAVETAMKLLAGQKVPKTITMDTQVFTKENIEQGGKPVDEAVESKH